MECDISDCNQHVAPGSPANLALAYVASLQIVSSDIFWCRLCSGAIFRTINKYNVATTPSTPSTDVTSEQKTFVKRFLPRVARSSRLAVSMPLGYVSKRFEGLVTSGKTNSSMFSNFVHDQRVH